MTELMPHKTDTGLTWPHPLPTCWCLTDGRPGMENQAVGLAEAMGLTPVVKRVILKTPWRIASPHVTAFKRYAFSKKGDPVDSPWPDILIATGRPSILPSLYVKGQSGGRTFTVQLQDPVSLRWRFDRIVVPAHDGLSGENVIVMDGALHRITPQKLAAEAPRWAEAFAAIPKPRIAVLLGGDNSRYRFGEAEARALAGQLKSPRRAGIRASHHRIAPHGRRQPRHFPRSAGRMRRVHFRWRRRQSLFRHAGPRGCVHRHLRLREYDHRSLQHRQTRSRRAAPRAGRRVSERDKFARFQRGLEESGRIRFFKGTIETWAYEPLREMERIASLIQQAYLSRAA